MLHSKIIHCPATPEEISLAALPLAKMAMDYSIELGIGTKIFDTETFIKGWMEGSQHVLGFYNEAEQLVGMVLGITQTQMFSNDVVLTVQTAYINRDHRQAGAQHVMEALAASKQYASEIGASRIVIHAEVSMVEGLSKMGGKHIYAGMEFDV